VTPGFHGVEKVGCLTATGFLAVPELTSFSPSLAWQGPVFTVSHSQELQPSLPCHVGTIRMLAVDMPGR
jgi:hypothetical protein